MIDFDGRPVSFANPREAISAGVGMVHQHFKLAPTFTVAENIILGSEPMRSVGRIDVKRAEAETKALSEAFGLISIRGRSSALSPLACGNASRSSKRSTERRACSSSMSRQRC